MEGRGRSRAAGAPQRGRNRGRPAASPQRAGGGRPAVVRCGAKGRAPALAASAAGSCKGEWSRAATGRPLATCCRGVKGRGGAGLPPRHEGEDEDAALAPTAAARSLQPEIKRGREGGQLAAARPRAGGPARARTEGRPGPCRLAPPSPAPSSWARDRHCLAALVGALCNGLAVFPRRPRRPRCQPAPARASRPSSVPCAVAADQILALASTSGHGRDNYQHLTPTAPTSTLAAPPEDRHYRGQRCRA